MAGLQKRLPEIRARSAAIVGISSDEAPESRLLRASLKLDFALLHDEAARVADAYGVRMAVEEIAIPSVFVIDREGGIAWRHIGEYVPDRPTPDAVLAALDALAS